VNGTANISAPTVAGEVECKLAAESGGGAITSSTEAGFAHLANVDSSQTIPETGVLHVSPNGVIDELCFGTPGLKIYDAGISATRLTSGSTSSDGAAVRNKFVKPLKAQKPTLKR